MRALFVILFAAALTACNPADVAGDVKAAEKSVALFHTRLNNAKYDDIYYASAKEMKDSEELEGLTGLLTAVHGKLGNNRDSKLAGWRVNYQNGAQYIELTMTSEFEKGPAQESFIFKKADNDTMLVGYNIQSRALIMN